MKKLFLLLLTIVVFVSFPASLLFGLSGEPKREFDEFIRNLREEKRIDQIGYLILVQIPLKKSSEDKILSLAGKFFYACEEGYLTHVNYARLQKFQKEKLSLKILDKKRLDDRKEAWYLVWTNSLEDEKTLEAKFEPLFKHQHTSLIRIKPEDEDYLLENKLRYSILEEELLPPKVSKPFESGKTIKVDPFIKDLVASVTVQMLASTVQTLEDFKSRYVSDPGNLAATHWLASEFAKIPSLEVATPTFSSYSGTMSNVIATKKGEKEPDSVYVVCGHFDSTSSGKDRKIAPGADDNGSGAAGVLEIARQIGRLRFPCTIIFACMNAEEIGLIGSKAFAKKLAATTGIQIKAVFNMDMIGDKDDNQVAVIGNSRSNWLIDVFKDAASAYTGLQSTPLYNSNIWYSDHSSFWNVGASAILTIEGYPEMSPYYHSSKDLLKNMAPSLMEKITRSNLAALLSLNPPIVAKTAK